MNQESVRGSQGVVHFAACTAQVRVPWPGTRRPCLPSYAPRCGVGDQGGRHAVPAAIGHRDWAVRLKRVG